MLTTKNPIAGEDRTEGPPGDLRVESGFTLIELMVVLLIIAILVAVAIPTFLGVSTSARDRSAQSSLTNAMTDAIAYYQNGQTYDATTGVGGTTASQTGTGVGSTAGVLHTFEPAFSWVAGGTACTIISPKCVSILPVDVASTDDGQGVILAVMSPTGDCWYALDLEIGAEAAAAEAANGFAARQSALPVSAGGTYYATETGSSVSCSAAHAQSFTSWYGTYASAKSE